MYLLVSAVDGDCVGVGLEEGVEVREGRLPVAPLEEAALAARGKDLSRPKGNKLLIVGPFLITTIGIGYKDT